MHTNDTNMNAKLYDVKGEVVGDIELSDKIFARPWNPNLVHQALVTQEANARRPWAHTKDRAEVSGGGRKPWKQKHTGRARHGSIRSPLWRGGGVTHGPRKEKIYAKKLNKKMLRGALYAVLSRRLADEELRIVDSLAIDAPKTKALFVVLKGAFGKTMHALLVPAKGNRMLFRVSRNIPRVKTIDAASLNVKDLLRYKHIVIDKAAIADII